MAERLAGLVIAALSLVLGRLPRRALLAAGRGLGLALYRAAPARRRIALRNLQAAMGDSMTPGEIRSTVRSSFAHLGMNLAEFLSFPSLDGPTTLSLMEFDGEENLREALSRGRGALVLTAHVGNWDLLAAALARKGYPVALVSKVSRSDAVNRVWMGYRESAGIRVLRGSGMMKDILRHLRDGGIVGFVLDQNALREDGVFVPFFGKMACTLSSLAVIARRTGAPVVPAFSYRDGMGHRGVIEPALSEAAVDDHDRDVLERTARYTRWTEETIRRHPDQWTWLHDRWRTRPEGEKKESRVQSLERGVQSQERQGDSADPGIQLSTPDSPLSTPPHRGAAAVFLDRDGTILDELGYLGKPEDMRIYPFAAEALRTLQAAGYRLVVVTNQSGVGRGYFGEEDALAVNLAMVQRLAEEGVRLDAVLYCPHPPDGGCSCRKPATLMIQRAADDLGVDPKASWMVGDTGTDAAAGANGGTRAIVVGTGKAEKGDIPSGALVLPDLARAASFIAGEGRR